MGSISSRKLARVVEHVRRVLAIEMMVAAQGLDLRKPHKPGTGVLAGHAALRKVVPTLTEDRPLYKDMEVCTRFLADRHLATAVAERVGPLV